MVASLFMVRSKLCALTCTTRRRPIPDRGPSRLDGRVKPRRELRCRRSLIYKLPVLRWSGATARYSRLYVPVETSTPPRRRSKLHITRFAVYGKACSLRCSSAPDDPASLGFVRIGKTVRSSSYGEKRESQRQRQLLFMSSHPPVGGENTSSGGAGAPPE